MSIEIKIPSVGESVQEAVLAEWFKQDGDTVRKDEPLFVIETDKVTLEVVAEADGVLKILVAAGETVAIGTVVGSLEPVDAAAASAPEKPKTEAAPHRSRKKHPPRYLPHRQPKPRACCSGHVCRRYPPGAVGAPADRRKESGCVEDSGYRPRWAHQQGRCAALPGEGAGRHPRGTVDPGGVNRRHPLKPRCANP